jgi:hypothetical protein
MMKKECLLWIRALLPLACNLLKESGYATAVPTTKAGTRAERFYCIDGWIETGPQRGWPDHFSKEHLSSFAGKSTMPILRDLVAPPGPMSKPLVRPDLTWDGGPCHAWRLQ